MKREQAQPGCKSTSRRPARGFFDSEHHVAFTRAVQPRYRPQMDLSLIPTFADDDNFHVVIEAPRGSTLKFKYEPRWQAMSISRPLPLGVTYPFDWGFVPSTRAADGDPLDAMVLWDVPSYPGVVVECRAIGVLHVEQNRTNHDPSQRIRNDRIMAIPIAARRQHGIKSFAVLSARVRQELEHFAMAATALEGKDLRIIGWGDAPAAIKLVQDSAYRQRRKTRTARRRTPGPRR
jgi:inorganic pyrophosphatase